MNGAATLELTFFAMIVAVFVGMLIGLLSGRYRDSPLDAGGRLFGIVVYATPVFFLGLLAQLIFGVWLGWLPISDQASPITQALLQTHTNIFFLDAIIDGNWSALWDITQHLILPATTLGIVYGGVFIRLIRVNVIRTMKEDYIEAARARGIKRALGRLPPRVPQRARAGHHRRRPPARAAARRRDPHGDDVQLAGPRP